jgi:hypothetical protein
MTEAQPRTADLKNKGGRIRIELINFIGQHKVSKAEVF